MTPTTPTPDTGQHGRGPLDNAVPTASRLRRLLAAAGPKDRHRPPGTVVFTFGRYFAPKADLLTREGFKTIPPLDGVSPFCAAGEADPEMGRFVSCDRTNDRVKAEVTKDLTARLAASGADYLLVDNSAAALWHRERDGRYYTIVSGDQTDLTDELWPADEADRREYGVRPAAGLDDDLREAYQRFIEACLAAFPPERIILVRSRGARYSVSEDGTVAPTNLDRASARLLDELDDAFVEQVGCRVADAALDWNPTRPDWLATDHRLRIALEQQVVDLIGSPIRADGADNTETVQRRKNNAADHVVTASRNDQPVDEDWLRRYFAGGPVTRDDLLALVWLHQRDSERHAAVVRDCAASVVSDAGQPLVAATRRRFSRSLTALANCPWRTVDLPPQEPWRPQVSIDCGCHVFRFDADGALDTITTATIDDPRAVVAGEALLTPANLAAALASWPWYFERGRRGVTAAPRVVVADAEALVDSCHWLDWSWALANENLVITTPDTRPARLPGPRTKSDLSFVFDRRTRICTVGGGLMDQVTHIALHDELCSPHGLRYYIDDFRYTWWRSHNGFEASRLAPGLESRRMTRLVSQALIDTFRSEVMATRLPWVFNQSRIWHAFGLQEAVVVTKSHPNALRMLQSEPDFPILVYRNDDDLGRFIRNPPGPVTFYTTQHRIAIAEASAPALRRTFDYRHLVGTGPGRSVARTADQLRSSPHVAFHVRRGDYLEGHFDVDGWHSAQEHYVAAIDHLISEEFGTTDFDVAVFSDDLDFVAEHRAEYGLDKITGTVRFIGGNQHYRAILDSYLMSLCPVIVGSVGAFAATTSLLAAPPSTFIRTTPNGLTVAWRR